jgi:hypothetical protein
MKSRKMGGYMTGWKENKYKQIYRQTYRGNINTDSQRDRSIDG